MIDINQSVPQGEDVVIPEGGDIHLGTYAEFNRKAALGLLTGVWSGAYAQYLEVEPSGEIEVKPLRDAQGHFIKKGDTK